MPDLSVGAVRGGIDPLVDGADGVAEMGEGVREKSGGGGLEGFRDDLRHLLEDGGGGDVAGISTAHAVGNGEDEVVAGERVAAVSGEDFGAVGTGGEGDERVVIARFPRTAVGEGCPVEDGGLGHGWVFEGDWRFRWIFRDQRSGGGGRISASSKSMMQKQPSLSE